ncbi:hypothetical protein [Pseudomonas sp. MN1F]|uniref:hypothetical protein n=1 Tax=Pseudomonas sp. MN1F TaxID=1366632 RepID=UPI00128F5E90|nr:hypothetical protein [Pseudomonas sp. MN1F]MQG96356.1 hypothetical protein [Pseudomonas sp. MN1F]
MKPGGRKTERWALRLWGGLDALSLLLYVVASIRRGHLPFVTDLDNMLSFLDEQGFVTSVLVVMNLVLQVSIILSAVLLLGGRKAGVYLGLAQIPLRLLFATPSLSVLLIWASLVPGYDPWLMLGLIGVSELSKGGTSWWWLRRQRLHHWSAGS